MPLLLMRASTDSRHCAVPGCASTRKDRVFKFPKNPEVGRKWIEAVRNPDLTLNVPYNVINEKQYSVCYRHFSPHQIRVCGRGLRRLMTGAVPCVRLLEEPRGPLDRLSRVFDDKDITLPAQKFDSIDKRQLFNFEDSYVYDISKGKIEVLPSPSKSSIFTCTSFRWYDDVFSDFTIEMQDVEDNLSLLRVRL